MHRSIAGDALRFKRKPDLLEIPRKNQSAYIVENGNRGPHNASVNPKTIDVSAHTTRQSTKHLGMNASITLKKGGMSDME